MWVVLLVALVVGAAAADGAGEAGPAGRGARYAATATVLLGDEAARGAELGYRLRAELAARPLWAHDHQVLLHFTLENPQLMLRGKKLSADFVPRPSLWDERPSSEFLALWSAGRISEAYLDPHDPPDVLNYKKALISLFQFQTEESEHNETDVSGECEVQYERVAQSEFDIRKVKHRCLWDGRWDDEGEVEVEGEGEAGAGGVERRRVLRLALASGGVLRAARQDDLLLLRGAGEGALTARALLELRREGEEEGEGGARAHSLAAALAAHPALVAHALPLRGQDRLPDEPQEELSLEQAVAAHGAALDEARAGSADAAAAALALLPAVRRAPAAQLVALLEQPASSPLLPGLARMLGLAGSAGAHAAARTVLALEAPARPGPAREYLAALAHAPAADARVVRRVLALAGGSGVLAPDALLAAATAAARARDPALAADVKDELLKGLARCKDDPCRVPRLQALGQLRGAGVAELLLAHAERGAGPAALAALHALGPAAAGHRPPALSAAQRRRLERLALALDAPRPLDVRSHALQLALEAAAPHWGSLRGLTLALRSRGPRELRRVCRQRLETLAERHPALAAMLPALDPRSTTWLGRAYDGTSSVLARSARWARLDSAQLAAAGVLRRGAVALSALGAPLLTVELWTRGLEAWAGSAPPPPGAREPEDEPAGTEEEDAAGGLALTVAGARRSDVALFASQAELLGHVWAGTGSEPTPVLRALLPRPAAPRRLPLAAGLLLTLHTEAAVAMALDAQAQVSLWGRTATAGLALRGAGVETLELRARTAWGHVAARAHSRLEPALALDAALDFYAAPQLCVRAVPRDHVHTRNVTLQSQFGPTQWRVRRERVSTTVVPGRTLALGAPNDQACRALGAAAR